MLAENLWRDCSNLVMQWIFVLVLDSLSRNPGQR